MLACVAGSVQAQSVFIGKRLIGRGDSIERVREAGGEPKRIDRIEADGDAPPMQIWTYERRGRQVTVWIVEGRVASIGESARADGPASR